MAPQKKITIAEAHQWIKNVVIELEGAQHPIIDDEVLTEDFFNQTRPIGFKEPKKVRVSQKRSSASSDASERSEEDYDCTRCDARASKKQKGLRFDFQCSHAKIDGECFCKNHLKQSNSTKGLELGKITEDRPQYWADGKAIPWHDADPEILASLKKKKTSKKKPVDQDAPKKPRKCGLCGETGHTKRSCPQASRVPLSPKDENTEEVVAEVLTAIVDHISSDEETNLEQKEEAPNVEQKEEAQKVEQKEEDSGVGTGLVSLQLEEDDSSTQALSEDETDEEEENIPFLFQGVQYEREPSGDQSVFDEEGDTVGSWNGEEIKFISASLRMEHEKKANILGESLDTTPKSTEAKDYLKMATKELRKIAKSYGISADDIDDTNDTDNPKEALILLIKNTE